MKGVQTQYGEVSGVDLGDGAVAFLGVPYAAPPVGDLRFAHPEPPKKWKSKKECVKNPRMPPQDDLTANI